MTGLSRISLLLLTIGISAGAAGLPAKKVVMKHDISDLILINLIIKNKVQDDPVKCYDTRLITENKIEELTITSSEVGPDIKIYGTREKYIYDKSGNLLWYKRNQLTNECYLNEFEYRDGRLNRIFTNALYGGQATEIMRYV